MTPAGIMQVHGYPYSADASTIILEMAEDVWLRAGGEDLISERPVVPLLQILDGHSLISNNSRWTTFTTVRCRTWRDGNIVLLGDAAHTAHFSIGSGTKLAMEDALALAACLHETPGDVLGALEAYEAERRPVVASTQRAAPASLGGVETSVEYTEQHPHQFAFNILTRSRRVTHDNLRLRDPEFAEGMDRWFSGGPADPPMFQPFQLGGVSLANRV